MVACAFVLKALQSDQMILLVIGIILGVFALLRMKLVDAYMKDVDDESIQGEDSITQYLKRDELLYADALVVYQKGNCEVLYDERDGFLFYDHTSKQYYGSASSIEGAKDIVSKLPLDYDFFIAYDDVFTKLTKQDFAYCDMIKSYNYVYEAKKPYIVESHGFILKMLSEDDVDEVKKQYSVKDLCTDEYILECIRQGMLGAYDKDTLAGFIGMHSSGAIGLLEVKEAYRNQHLATILEEEYINMLLKKDASMSIYTQVTEGNTISMHLQEKLGFVKAGKPMYWYFS